ncbi:MAG: DegV family protein [Atopostipes suicloacalis]|nr:DegV family protein [Atopostipes suicloacalis]
MNKEKIALLVDSGSDVPKDMVEKYDMYVAPLKIVYRDREYVDGVEITTEEVLNRLEEEIPTTSLPTGETIQQLFHQIKEDGYEKVLAVTLSSGLSGTYNSIRLLAEQQDALDIFVLDTKNISIASGFNAIQAGEYIKEGMDWDTLIRTVSEKINQSKVFFTVESLDYLRAGGRIGLVASLLGSRLNIRPIISCNDEGIYYSVKKVRGQERSIKKAIDLAVKHVGKANNYNIGVVHAGVEEKAAEIRDRLIKKLPDYNILVEGEISPVLSVHTGPGSIGIVTQVL